MAKRKLITEYKAATLTAMSPELLRWLTSHAPKHGIKRKLRVMKVENEILFFAENEVLDFNNWLKEPWPRKDGKRPHIPTSIRREIKQEANGACAICQNHRDTCEAAHLDPVARSDNNHPDNLLWLCSNHHMAYDKGLFGPDEENFDFVASFKQVLRRHKVTLWRLQHEVSHKIFMVLENCNGLKKQLELAKTKDQVEAVEKLAKETFAVLPALAPVSKADPKYSDYKTISANVVSLSKGKVGVAARLDTAEKIRKDYVAAYGFVACPLCEGSGHHEGTDCPVCNGDREIERRFAEAADLREYEMVSCPVCEGDGILAGNPCPACDGEAQMARHYTDNIDVRDYEAVTCRLCVGDGRHKGDDCPVCGGLGEIERRHDALIDLKEFDDVQCPLCEGSGRHDGEDCPECGAEGCMQRRFAEMVNFQDYQKMDCPVCEGRGSRFGDDCPACGGEAQIDRRDLDNIEVQDYRLVKCPLCGGKCHYRGDDCPACGGEGEMERRFADRIDPGVYG